MPLCTTADVEALIQSDITNDADSMIVALLEMASGAVEAEVGRTLEAQTFTSRKYSAPYPNDGRLFLDHWPIASVASVTEAGTALVVDTDYAVDLELGILTRLSSGVVVPWDPTTLGIEATYDTTVPVVARTETARLTADAFIGGANYAARAALANGEMVGLRQLTVGRWSATAETGAGSGTVGVQVDELARSRLAAIKTRTP